MTRGQAAAAATPPLPDGVRRVAEQRGAGDVPLHPHPEWRESWLVQGTTGRGEDDFDLGLFGGQPVGNALERWRALRRATRMPRAIHAHQVHGAEIMAHGEGPPGLLVAEGVDGHTTDRPGTLLTVSVADCVPIFLVDAERRAIAILHGGWRGTAAGVMSRGIEALGRDRASRLDIHMGPAICGPCYEVGPEVHEALGLPRPGGPAPVDVRSVQARQAIECGATPARITVSEHCTRCGTGFFSHRGGSAGRQLGVLGIHDG